MEPKLNQNNDKLNSGIPKGLRALKILVVIMGVMIIAGVITIVATIILRLSDFSNPINEETRQLTDLAGKKIELPNGSHLVSMHIEKGRIFIHLKSESGNSSLLILDSSTLKKLGQIDFQTTE